MPIRIIRVASWRSSAIGRCGNYRCNSNSAQSSRRIGMERVFCQRHCEIGTGTLRFPERPQAKAATVVTFRALIFARSEYPQIEVREGLPISMDGHQAEASALPGAGGVAPIDER